MIVKLLNANGYSNLKGIEFPIFVEVDYTDYSGNMYIHFLEFSALDEYMHPEPNTMHLDMYYVFNATNTLPADTTEITARENAEVIDYFGDYSNL